MVRLGKNVILTRDLLVGLGIICLMISLRGPLAVTAAGPFIVRALTLFGIPRLFGVEVSPVVVIMIVVGVCVALVTRRDHRLKKSGRTSRRSVNRGPRTEVHVSILCAWLRHAGVSPLVAERPPNCRRGLQSTTVRGDPTHPRPSRRLG